MPTVAETLQRAEHRLAPTSETPRLDAELLLARAFGRTRGGLLSRMSEPVEDVGFEILLARRAAGEPIAHILGTWEFFSLEIEVEPPALVPRPETEHLVETVLEFIGAGRASVLELCTGTGCAAVAIAVNAKAARVLATDREPRYVALARRNAARHGLAERVRVAEGDLFAAVPAGEAAFDAICANPPYITAGDWGGLSETIRRYEDPGALIGGEDGLDVVRRIVAGAGERLRPGGLLAIEIGQGQAAEARRLMEEAGFRKVRSLRDLAGIERIVSGVFGE